MFVKRGVMAEKQYYGPNELAGLAKKYREEKGKRRADAARDMGVKQTSIFHAEESPEKPYTKLRVRMIEEYSPFRVTGPVFLVRRK